MTPNWFGGGGIERSPPDLERWLITPGEHDLAKRLGPCDADVRIVVLEAAGHWRPRRPFGARAAVALLHGGPVQVSYIDGRTELLDWNDNIATETHALCELVNVEMTVAALVIIGPGSSVDLTAIPGWGLA